MRPTESMNLNKIFSLITIFSLLAWPQASFAALSCSVSASCVAPAAVIMQLSGSDNAHAEAPGGLDYLLNNVCCTTGVAGLGNSCSGNFQTVASLSGTTNAHVEQTDQVNYLTDVCISDSNTDNSISVAYQDTNCTGYDTTLASISGTTNAHVGDANAYTRKICASVGSTSITFTNDDATIGFGTLTTANARYANGAGTGSGTDVVAHTLGITTTATSGYSLTYTGPTLTSGANTIPAATFTSDANGTPGTAQFAISGAVTGTGSMATGYNNATPDWKYVAGTTTTLATSSGAAASASIGMHYIANISAATTAGTYTNTITYIVTGNF